MLDLRVRLEQAKNMKKNPKLEEAVKTFLALSREGKRKEALEEYCRLGESEKNYIERKYPLDLASVRVRC